MATPLNVLTPIKTRWGNHRFEWEGCKLCVIGAIAHNHVFARGTLPCEILFVGEAPGKTEDATGWPFVGKSGKMLDDWIIRAWQAISGADIDAVAGSPGGVRKGYSPPPMPAYAITNIVLCRPCDRPGGPNRAPAMQEIANCKPRFEEFVREIARPKVIVAVGKFADENRTWTRIPTLALRHPGYVLRIWDKDRNATEQQSQVEKLSAFLKKEIYGKVIHA